jgi:hypothetical protein
LVFLTLARDVPFLKAFLFFCVKPVPLRQSKQIENSISAFSVPDYHVEFSGQTQKNKNALRKGTSRASVKKTKQKQKNRNKAL